MSLYGVYGSHTVEACPVNNLENGKKLVSFAESDPAPFLSTYRINNVLGQYHSAFEHTFLWVVDAEDPHLIEEFALEPSRFADRFLLSDGSRRERNCISAPALGRVALPSHAAYDQTVRRNPSR